VNKEQRKHQDTYAIDPAEGIRCIVFQNRFRDVIRAQWEQQRRP
jgi:hypothetical protein